MVQFPEQVVAVQQASLDFFFDAIGKTFEGMEKLIRLNLNTAKNTLSDWYQRTQDGLTQEDGQKIGALQSALALPSAEMVLTYGRQVAEITSTMQTQLAEVFEVQCQQANHQVQAFVDSVAKNGPTGSEAAVAFLSQVITLASTGQQSAYKAAKQVVNFARDGLRAVTGATEVVDVVDEEVQKKPAKVPKP
jgi:phasin family protein